MAGNPPQLLGYAGRGQNKIYRPTGTRAAGHAKELRAPVVLRERDAPFSLHRRQTQRPVGARSREHYRDRPVLLLTSQRPEEPVDRHRWRLVLLAGREPQPSLI